ncbi:MAG: cob(I)yrinic acid a,c-diamide adenosyltransferase [Oscillospiraceae bacterium]
MLQIYTGDGKGKTTASLGCVVRAVGAGMKVLFCQFLKGTDTSEIEVLEKIGVKIIRTDEIKTFFAFMTEIQQKDCKTIHEVCYNNIMAEIKLNNYDLIVFDEVFPAISLELLDGECFFCFLKEYKKNHELILTGRIETNLKNINNKIIKNIIEIADYISEINCIKHPYNKGVAARKGIEF